MRAAINCALANRQVLTHLTRRVFGHFFPTASLDLLFDVSHNTCKEERHDVARQQRRVFVHRKGATRAFAPGHPDLPPAFAATGQPVFIGGSMGTASANHGRLPRSLGARLRLRLPRRRAAYEPSPSPQALAGPAGGPGAGGARRPHPKSFHAWRGRGSSRAYKDVQAAVAAAAAAGLARRVATLSPIICVKG
jgi:tRNA-splicing ligase RtcB